MGDYLIDGDELREVQHIVANQAQEIDRLRRLVREIRTAARDWDYADLPKHLQRQLERIATMAGQEESHAE